MTSIRTNGAGTPSDGGRVLGALRARISSMLDDLAQLVAVESPSGDDTAAAASADVVTAVGTRLLGTRPTRVGPHLLWAHGPTRVLIVGHHDTVWPIGTAAGWPFSVRSGRASGPGCFDMKAGLVQLFHAVSVLPSPRGVSVVVNADEESGSPTSRGLLQRAADGAVAALVCEPSADGALKTSRHGFARFDLSVVGRAAHAGLDPSSGANAAVELAAQVLAVAALSGPQTPVTPTVMRAGTSRNTVPAAATLTVDVRADRDEEFARIERALRSLRPRLEGTRLVVSGGVHRPALPASASARLFAVAGDSAADLGLPAPVGVGVRGASDGNLLARLGVPTLDGLGAVGGNAHAEGEWVEVDAMPDRAALLARIVERLLAAAPARAGGEEA